ncbi:MAG: helix-turn-helix transcriptional regulator [Planctomycetes bacterium]|nr:helix-turn-helix transcriptional regulator [Planctomycetota bacterium]
MLDLMANLPPSPKSSAAYRAILKEAKHQGLTAYALAKDTGLSINTVRGFLIQRGSPTLTTVEAIARALGLAIQVSPIKGE